jgi:CheY-like chemotaxis protein
LHFNSRRVIESNQDTIINNNNNAATNPNFLLIDNLKVDDHLRITFTRRIRNIFSVQIGDMIDVYRNLKDSNIIFNVKREGVIIESWTCKKGLDKESDDNKSGADIYSNDSTRRRRSNNNTSRETIPKVMIIDDDEDMLFTFKTILNDNSIAAETFANSDEALIRFAEEDPSYFKLVIVDIKMQGINGLQLYKIIKAMTRGTSTTKFLFVSAFEYAEEFISILPGVKPNDIIKKPIQRENLAEKVKEILSIQLIEK